MILKKVIFIFIVLCLSTLCTGCATYMWNQTIDRIMLVPSFDQKFEVNHFPVKKIKGYFYGIKEHDNKKYYNFVVPNVFKGYSKEWIEIILPVASEDKNAILTKVDSFEGNRDYIYINYQNSFTSGSKIDLDSLNYYAPNPFEIDNTVSYKHPTLIAFCLPNYGSGAYIRIGQKININEPSNINANLQGKLYLVCQKTGENPKYILAEKMTDINKDSSGNCEWWYWSDTYVSNAFDPFKSIEINIYRGVGYIVTVPIDIVTSPIQLLIYLLIKDLKLAPV
jgi:hypothetical protein